MFFLIFLGIEGFLFDFFGLDEFFVYKKVLLIVFVIKVSLKLGDLF